MEGAKFKKGNKVRIICNELEPKYVGREGSIHRVYQSFCDKGFQYCYRVNVGGRLLKGVANESDIERIE